MIFEVDNTTENLIKELQAGIADTILTLSEGQEKLGGKLDKIRQEFDEVVKTEQIEEASEDIQKIIKKMGIPYSQQQGEELLLLMKNAMSQVEELKEPINKIDELPKIADRCMENVKKENGTHALAIAQVEKSIQVLSEGMQRIEEKLGEVYTKEQGEEVLFLLKTVSQNVEQLVQLEKENKESIIQIENYIKQPVIKRLFKGKGETPDET